MLTAAQLIDYLHLSPLPEGGYFRETFRSNLTLPHRLLGKVYSGERQAGTAIYYLLTTDTVSALHKLPGDEIFHFYLGDPVEMLQLKSNGTGEVVILGNDVLAGMSPQVVVAGGTWQGSKLARGGHFALMGTTMAPGFDFDDYQTGSRDALIKEFPAFAAWIEALTLG